METIKNDATGKLLYHITPHSNLASIKSEGLLKIMAAHTMQMIYLCDYRRIHLSLAHVAQHKGTWSLVILPVISKICSRTKFPGIYATFHDVPKKLVGDPISPVWSELLDSEELIELNRQTDKHIWGFSCPKCKRSTARLGFDAEGWLLYLSCGHCNKDFFLNPLAPVRL